MIKRILCRIIGHNLETRRGAVPYDLHKICVRCGKRWRK